MDGTPLPHEGTHDEPTVLLSRSLLAAMRVAEPLNERDDTATDVSALEASHAFGETTSLILSAAGPICSGEITAPTAQPTSDPTTATRLAPGFVHLVPGTLVSEYVVEKLLGSGGMGAVYGARHERLGRRVAIKVIAPSLSVDADAVERFEQEAQALAQLSHPNIVDVLSVGTLPGDGRNYFVMEWIDGESLHARLMRWRPPLEDALDILDQIARGLGAAHAAGIVHRDVKPDNVLLRQVGGEPRPIAKLLDFGLAKLASHRRTEDTAANVMFGTVAYMSPEQCRSTRDVGPATDVYALGCVAYELLCGRLPFTYDNAAELVVAHGSEIPPTPRSLNPAIPPELDALLTGMLAKNPSHRPTLAGVRRTITTVLAAPTSGPRPRLLTSAQRPRAPIHAARTRRVLVTLAGLVVLGLVAAAVVATSGGARFDKPGVVVEQLHGVVEPHGANKIDAGVPRTAAVGPSTSPDASVPLETPAPRIDENTVTPRSNVKSASPSRARPLPDGGVAKSASAIVVARAPKPAAVDTGMIDACVEPDAGNAPIEVEASIRPTTTSLPSHRSPPAPAAKKAPNRDVIVNPFRKKQITK